MGQTFPHGLGRNHLCPHLYLGLSSLQNNERITPCCLSTLPTPCLSVVLCYGNGSKPIQHFSLKFFFFFNFLSTHLRHMEVPRLGVESELQLSTYTTAHGNTGSLTHWVKPRMEPVSWRQVRFVSAKLWQELLRFFLIKWKIIKHPLWAKIKWQLPTWNN